jgi:hypothetical protein
MGYSDERGVYHAYHANRTLSLNDLREMSTAGAVGAIVANGGILASDTTPILRNATGVLAQEVSWATGNVDTVGFQITLPSDFDGRSDVLLDLWVNSGTTDLATFSVTSCWDGGATVTDSATDTGASATTHRITAIISKDDIPDAAERLTILLTPPTHATNAIQLQGLRLRWTPRVTS